MRSGGGGTWWTWSSAEGVRGYFGRDAAGVVEARRKLGLHSYEEDVQPALATLRDSTAPIEEVWLALKAAFNPTGLSWKAQGKRATLYMARLRELCLLGEPPVLGLTIHQAKGLEWDRVLLLNGELSTAPGLLNKLDRQHEYHRSVYVGLTRARSVLRVLPVPEDPHSKRVPIRHIATL